MRHLQAAAQEAQGGNCRGVVVITEAPPISQGCTRTPSTAAVHREEDPGQSPEQPHIQEAERVGRAADRTEWKEPKRKVDQS